MSAGSGEGRASGGRYLGDSQGEEDGEEAGGAVEAAAVSAVPLAPDLLTLSDVPPQKWLATLHLDLVKDYGASACYTAMACVYTCFFFVAGPRSIFFVARVHE